MIGLDTNVLVRLIVHDDSGQADRAAKVVLRRCTTGSPGYVNHVVLCELVWVLDARYGFGRETIAGAVEAIGQSADVRLQDPEAVRDALDLFVESRADFADCLIAVLNGQAGCARTLTFDRDAANLPAFELVP